METLEVQNRDAASKPKALRREGILPLALTRRNHTTIELQAPLDQLTRALKGSDAHGRFEIVVPGAGKMRVILKQQDIDYIHQKPLHATLMEVADDDVIKLDVAVLGVGTPEPVEQNIGLLTQPTDLVKVRGKVSDMPEVIEVDVSHLQIGDTISAGDLKLPENIELMSSPDAIVFTCMVAKMASIEVPTAEEEAEALEAQEAAAEGAEEGEPEEG